MDLESIAGRLDYLTKKSDSECFDFLETLNNHEINLINNHIYNWLHKIVTIINTIDYSNFNDKYGYLWESLDILLSKLKPENYYLYELPDMAYIVDDDINNFDENRFSIYIDSLKQYTRVNQLIEKFKNKRSDNNLVSEKDTIQNQYADKWYAFYHMILIALGKENNFPQNFGKKEIIKFGINKYKCKGEGFYKEINNIDLTKTYTYVSCLSPKDRANWKTIISNISNMDADIIAWLNKQPN